MAPHKSRHSTRPEARTTRPAWLKRHVAGSVIVPGDSDYDDRRKVWNGSIDRRPALIVRCAEPGDVRAAVRYAAEEELLTAVRGGGHSFPGLSTCDGGIVIDVGPMADVQVDPAARLVRVSAGALLGDVDRATQRHGLAVPAGIVTHTGIAGLTLGGGLGWLQRKYGLSIDNLLSADVVTADGSMVTASADSNPDLFWGLRGAGGNFGVVTSFTFRARPIGPQVIAGPVFWPASKTRRVLQFYRDWVADCPDEITTIVVQRRLPPLPATPPELVGQHVVAVVACYAGPVAEGKRILRPVKQFDSPLLDLCEPKPFLAHQGMFDPSYNHGGWYYTRACNVAELTDGVIDIAVEHGAAMESTKSSAVIWQMGGAVSRVPEDATAFTTRSAGYTFNIGGNTETEAGFDAERTWARDYWSALAPHHLGAYVNFLMDEGPDRVMGVYGPDKHSRLQRIKRSYDPTNLFRLNQNINPN